jgi:glucose/arabinose dehydrogenase
MRLNLVPVAAALSLAISGVASAAPPNAPRIFEPPTENVSPGDVHMEATDFADPDGDSHQCSDWEIVGGPDTPNSPAWDARCATGPLKVHIHLGDGEFHPYPEESELAYETDYLLRVRFIDSSGEAGPWSERRFRTERPGPPGRRSAVPWDARQRGYAVEPVAGGLRLPVNIAMVPHPRSGPRAPLLYVTELYGNIKLVRRNGRVTTYARNLLNFDPSANFPGSGEVGLTGIVVDPRTGDVFASMVYAPQDPALQRHYGKVVRFRSSDGGRVATRQTTVLDIPEPQGPSHQISDLSIGSDRKLYVHVADGHEPEQSQNLESFLGKVLRVNLDGSPPRGNPFYDASDGITPRDYVYALGLRNPFGGAWRAANNSLYLVGNGPFMDRFARVVPGRNFLWDGTNESMRLHALYNWAPSHAPLNIAFVQRDTASRSGFAAQKMDHAFVTESGPTWATGPQFKGKRIVEFVPDRAGRYRAAPRTFVEYTGVGKATTAGLAAAPDGLYFTDLYKDVNYRSPIQRGAKVWRVRETRKPRISRLRFEPRTFRVGYRASEPAVVSARIKRARGERRAFGASASDRADRGPNRFRLTSRADRQRLEPGQYVLVLRARDVAGNRSRPARAHFRIAR